MEVDVQQAPVLYQETSPSVWQQCHDFTGGEASCLRCANTMSSLCLCSLQPIPCTGAAAAVILRKVLHWCALHVCLFGRQLLQAQSSAQGPVLQYTDCLMICRTHKVLFPSNTVMNLLQDLVLREPRLAALTTNCLPATTAAPGQSCLPSYCPPHSLYPSMCLCLVYKPHSCLQFVIDCHVIDCHAIDCQCMQIHW